MKYFAWHIERDLFDEFPDLVIEANNEMEAMFQAMRHLKFCGIEEQKVVDAIFSNKQGPDCQMFYCPRTLYTLTILGQDIEAWEFITKERIVCVMPLDNFKKLHSFLDLVPVGKDLSVYAK